MDDLFAQAPSPYGFPFIMLDRVVSYDRAQRKLAGIKCVPRNEPMMHGHFPGFPIFPGVLLIECLLQASSFLMRLDRGMDARAKNLLARSRIKHMEPVYPGETVELETQILKSDSDGCTFKVRALVRGSEVTKGQISLRPPERV
jgi:3-hydroxyacyl-[acyl-carrier-protein] dehydratase